MKKNSVRFCCLMFVLFALFSAGCRNEQDPRGWEASTKSPKPNPGQDQGSPSSGSRGSYGPRGIINLMPAPEGNSTQDDTEYATELRVVAGCGQDDPKMVSVAKNHTAVSDCERISVTLLRNNNGDLYEVAVPVQWSITNVQAVSLDCLNGPKDDLCSLLGHEDSFDTDPEGDSEPMTDLIICALNNCPMPTPADCQSKICTSLSVASIVNIEGNWVFKPDMLPQGQSVSILQDGRSFSDPWVGIKDGLVQGKAVSFTLDDYLYVGQFYPDRNHMNGAVIDSINNSAIGYWSAARNLP